MITDQKKGHILRQQLVYTISVTAFAGIERLKLGFKSLTLLTNGLLLPGHGDLLPHINRLVVSLDTVDPDMWDQTLRAAPGTAGTIIKTIITR